MLMMALVLAVSLPQPAWADDSDPTVLRDTEAEALLHDTVAPLVKAAGMDPNNVDVILLGSPTINAFVATGQHIYVYSGLLLDLDNVNELQGVLAHELGHITAGDAIRASEGQKSALGMQMAKIDHVPNANAARAG
jgi:predicted Zn-dependent protease